MARLEQLILIIAWMQLSTACVDSAARHSADCTPYYIGPKHTPNLLSCKPNHRPYPIIVGSIMSPEREVSPKFFPFEFTPLYVGMAPVADYTKPTALGGGLMEPVGFNSLAPMNKVTSKWGNEVSRVIA